HAKFTGIVSPQVRVAEEAGNRCDVDDVASKSRLLVLRSHDGNSGTAAEEDATEIRLHLHIPLLRCKVGHIAESAEARVVGEHVQPTRLLDDGLKRALY